MAVRALLWERISGITADVRCNLCAHYCRIPDGAAGRCRMRANRGGILYSLASDRIVAANADPVEKKPLYHFLPGTKTFSLGMPGCNMTCGFCQNHTISQACPPPFESVRDALPPGLAKDVVSSARSAGCASVAFTYNEPTVGMELMHAAAPFAREAGLETILVSNGFLSKEAMTCLESLISAANFDLKSFSEDFYRKICGAALAPVLRSIGRAVACGWWVEVTTLLIPEHNDSDEELARIARFIKEELGAHVPWHISRFRAMYAMQDVRPASAADVERAHAIGRAEGLRFVYVGNAAGHEAENTFCPECGAVFIRRAGYRVSPPLRSACGCCGTAIPGVWGGI